MRKPSTMGWRRGMHGHRRKGVPSSRLNQTEGEQSGTSFENDSEHSRVIAG